ncbi:MAG: hypothetical protein IIA30_02515 [Myxococcales bacterium]|nr:hypothetical protein [Myxococcales bacterium]
MEPEARGIPKFPAQALGRVGESSGTPDRVGQRAASGPDAARWSFVASGCCWLESRAAETEATGVAGIPPSGSQTACGSTSRFPQLDPAPTLLLLTEGERIESLALELDRFQRFGTSPAATLPISKGEPLELRQLGYLE